MNKGLIGVLAVAAIAAAGWYWSETRSSGATSLATPLDGTAQGAPMAQVVVPAELSAQAQQGAVFYTAACASCHGADAAGLGFRAGVFRFLPTRASTHICARPNVGPAA